jgi:putative transposase
VVPKYRRPVLVRPVDTRLKALVKDIAADHDMTIHALEVMPDHVHRFVEGDATLGVAEIVDRFKGRISRELRQEFPHLRSRLPTLWSRSYFAGTVGNVSATVIRRDIEAQKGR